MKHLFPGGKGTLLYFCLLQVSVSAAFAQLPSSSARCQVSTSPIPVRAEGLTERLGDIVLQCSGSIPGTVFTGNFALFLPVGVTNRVDNNNQTRDAVLSVDLGSGYVGWPDKEATKKGHLTDEMIADARRIADWTH